MFGYSSKNGSAVDKIGTNTESDNCHFKLSATLHLSILTCTLISVKYFANINKINPKIYTCNVILQKRVKNKI